VVIITRHVPLAWIPSPPASGFHLGPLDIHVYGLMYVIGIALAIWITGRPWAPAGGNPALVYDVALWAVPARIIGGRIYFDITTPFDIPQHWWGPFAVWTGGLSISGGVAAAALAGAWRVRRTGARVGMFMNAVAPALLVAQAIGLHRLLLQPGIVRQAQRPALGDADQHGRPAELRNAGPVPA
jgi:prolipoprotein diacylglyceryltransferase